MSNLRNYGLTIEEGFQYGLIAARDGDILSHARAWALMVELVAPAPPDAMCEDCGRLPAMWLVDTQRAEGVYCMCKICAYHSVKNRSMRYVRKTELAGGKSAGALLAEPPAMAPGSAEAARQAGDHNTRNGE